MSAGFDEGDHESIPRVTLSSSRSDDSDFASDVILRLRARGTASTRYQKAEEVARGGQGRILHVWDEDLRRTLAMKVAHASAAEPTDLDDTAPHRLSRFIEEAQVTGQLDHPGIVPVHELGLDSEGQVYFTMKFVRGDSLAAVIRSGSWSQTRVLGLILKVCEAVAYAHSKGVVHRDLKPSNVMVGRFGEVYVMDWGLARVSGTEDTRDIRICPDPETTFVRSGLREGAGDEIVTWDGDVLGTPAYMPPEQAGGHQHAIGPHSDVYSVGAMIYHALAGHAPYVEPEASVGNRTILDRVVIGPPEQLQALGVDVPSELIAICETAMTRDPAGRYASMVALAEDLRAYLEHRVVRAYRTDALAKVEKWIRRNRILAGTLAAAALAVVALTVVLVAGLSRDLEAHREAAIRPSIRTHVATAKDLHAEQRMKAWLHEAGRIRADAPDYLDLNDPADSDLLRELDVTVGKVEQRLEGVTTLRDDPEWKRAIEGIASSDTYTVDGEPLRIVPQSGLVPLASNPQGYWEFLVTLSGEQPRERDANGHWRIEADTGIVLVLLPGAPAHVMGSDNPDHDPDRRTCIVRLEPFFISKHETTHRQWERIMGENPSYYAPGTTSTVPGSRDVETAVDEAFPVDSVSWDRAQAFCARLDLQLPTEAQWDYASRGGERGKYWWGESAEGASSRENLAGHGDGYPVAARVGSMAPNPFGLFDTGGNLAEWCRDQFFSDYGESRRETGDGVAPPETDAERAARGRKPITRVVRGGFWQADPETWGAVTRTGDRPLAVKEVFGFRVSRPLTR